MVLWIGRRIEVHHGPHQARLRCEKKLRLARLREIVAGWVSESRTEAEK